MPQGEDPDSFVRGHGQAGLDSLIERAASLQDFYLRRHALPPGASAFQRAQAARDALSELNPSDALLRGALLTRVAQHFGVNEEELRRSAADARPSPAASPQLRPRRQPASSPQAAAETELLYLLLTDRRLALRAASEGIVAAFQHWGALATRIVAAWQEHDQVDVGSVLDTLPQELEGLADRVSQADGRGPSEQDMDQREQLFVDCVRRLQTTQRKSARERLQQQIREAESRGDDEAVRRGLHQLQQLG